MNDGVIMKKCKIAPDVKKDILISLIAGNTVESISKLLGCNTSSVSSYISRNKARELLNVTDTTKQYFILSGMADGAMTFDNALTFYDSLYNTANCN